MLDQLAQELESLARRELRRARQSSVETGRIALRPEQSQTTQHGRGHGVEQLESRKLHLLPTAVPMGRSARPEIRECVLAGRADEDVDRPAAALPGAQLQGNRIEIIRSLRDGVLGGEPLERASGVHARRGSAAVDLGEAEQRVGGHPPAQLRGCAGEERHGGQGRREDFAVSGGRMERGSDHRLVECGY